MDDPLRNLSWQYDENHNMTARYDRIQDAGEEFVYDALDRLTEVRGGDNLEGGAPEGVRAEEEESRGDVKQLSFSGSWRGSGGRSSSSSRNPVYSFSLKAKSLVTIDLSAKTRYRTWIRGWMRWYRGWRWRWLDTCLYLKDSSGKVIATDDDGGYWLFSKISVVLDKGDYEIVAATDRGYRHGNFNISLDSAEPPPSINGEWERSGGRRAAHSGNPVIPIVVDEKAPLQIDLTSRQDTYLYLLNADKRVIARNDDGGAGYNSRLRLTLDPGQYYLVAATYRYGRSGDFQTLLSGPARFGTLRTERTTALGRTTSTRSFGYDAQGNIKSHPELGDYQYDPDRPHAVKTAGGNSYEYDANGSLKSKNGNLILWTSFNKPSAFVGEDGARTGFQYAPDRSRYMKRRYNRERKLISETFYLGKGREKTVYADGSERVKYFIYADGKLIAIHAADRASSEAPAAERIRYLHYDALGSVDTVTDGRGAIVERMSYDVFGKRLGGSGPSLTNRGFTGHEYIGELGLVHMNGRVYDPGIGRFLSPDPYVQAPWNSQSYNRYGYVLNNPLRYTDPSGYWYNPFEDIRDGLSNLFQQDPLQWIQDSFDSGARRYKAGVHNLGQNAWNLGMWIDLNVEGGIENVADLGTKTWHTGLNNAGEFGEYVSEHREDITIAATVVFVPGGLVHVAGYYGWQELTPEQKILAVSTAAGIGCSALGTPAAGGACSGFVSGYMTARHNGADGHDAFFFAAKKAIIGAAIGATAGYTADYAMGAEGMGFENYGWNDAGKAFLFNGIEAGSTWAVIGKASLNQAMSSSIGYFYDFHFGDTFYGQVPE